MGRLQYIHIVDYYTACLENPRDGGAWRAAIYGVAQSRTRLKRLSSSRLLYSGLKLMKQIHILMLINFNVAKKAYVQVCLWYNSTYLKTCKTTYYVLFTNTETCRKNIKTCMVVINTKLITVVNSQEGAKRNGLRRGHWPHLSLYLFLKKKSKENGAKD